MLPFHLTCQGSQEYKVQGKEAFQHKITSSLENQRGLFATPDNSFHFGCKQLPNATSGSCVSLLQSSPKDV